MLSNLATLPASYRLLYIIIDGTKWYLAYLSVYTSYILQLLMRHLKIIHDKRIYYLYETVDSIIGEGRYE